MHSLRLPASLALLLAASAAGCAGPRGAGPGVEERSTKPLVPYAYAGYFKEITPESLKNTLRELERYAYTLQLFESPKPEAHLEAFRAIDALSDPNIVFVKEPKDFTPRSLEESGDARLLAMARSPDAARAEAARKELGRRGGIAVHCFAFVRGFDLARWNAAKDALLAMGGAGRLNLALVLAGILLDPARRDEWESARFFLAEVGEIGYQVARSTYENYLRPSLPPDEWPLYPHEEKVVQIFMAMIQLSSFSFDAVHDLSKSGRAWQRRCLASAIGRSREVNFLPILERYAASDPHELVRAAAYRALAGIPGPEPGRILVRALANETDEIALMEIPKALVQMNYRRGVPDLIEIVDHPHYPVVRAVIQALSGLTNVRGLQTPAEWRAWWSKHKDRWNTGS